MCAWEGAARVAESSVRESEGGKLVSRLGDRRNKAACGETPRGGIGGGWQESWLAPMRQEPLSRPARSTGAGLNRRSLGRTARLRRGRGRFEGTAGRGHRGARSRVPEPRPVAGWRGRRRPRRLPRSRTTLPWSSAAIDQCPRRDDGGRRAATPAARLCRVLDQSDRCRRNVAVWNGPHTGPNRAQLLAPADRLPRRAVGVDLSTAGCGDLLIRLPAVVDWSLTDAICRIAAVLVSC